MKDLNFDTGVVTYNLNGMASLTFNPTDAAFIEKLYHAFEVLDKKQESYQAMVKKTQNSREIFDAARKMDEEMREIINETFGFDLCAALFGDMNVYAMADGLPVWANLMLAVMDEADTTFAREQKLSNPRISKYTKKYHR